MTLKDQKNIRKTLLYSYISVLLISQAPNFDINVIQDFLFQNSIDIDTIRVILMSLLNVNFLSMGYQERITTEYKSISQLYDEVIKRTVTLFKELECEKNPTATFTSYVYLYRGGYLSSNKRFNFSDGMKDLPLLRGVDVVLGTGVCRNISAMFVNIANKLGMEATNVSVKLRENDFANAETLSPMQLLHNKDASSDIIDKILLIADYIGLFGNHVISNVSYGGINYTYDPTNDIFLYATPDGNFALPNNQNIKIKQARITGFCNEILGHTEMNLNFINQAKKFALPKQPYEEYKANYLTMLQTLQNNPDMLERFYQDNEELYSEISERSENIGTVLKRAIPFN